MWITDKKWWLMALERALRSLAQGILVGIGECVVLWGINWKLAIGTGLGMALVSILTSVAFGLPEYKEE